MLEKQTLIDYLTLRGHTLVRQISQCAYVFYDGMCDYGLIVCKKSKPGYMKIHKRLEHSVNKCNLDSLNGVVSTVHLAFLEGNTGKVLVGEYGKLEKSSFTIKGCAVESIARDTLSDLTPYLKDESGATPFSWQEVCQKPLAEPRAPEDTNLKGNGKVKESKTK